VTAAEGPPAVRCGHVAVKPAIERLGGGRVRFVDGSEERIDQIVSATGYRISLPLPLFLAAGGRRSRLSLYPRIAAPALRGCFSPVSSTRRAGYSRWWRPRENGSPPCSPAGFASRRGRRCGGRSREPTGSGSRTRAPAASAATRTPTDGSCSPTCAERGGGYGTQRPRRTQGMRSPCDRSAHGENSQPREENGTATAMKEEATWRDPALGVARELELPQGRLRCFEAGSGPPIVFAHGVGCVNSVNRTDLADLQGDRVYEPMRGPENAGTGIRLRQRGRNRDRCAGKRRWSAAVRQTVQVHVGQLP
jgi:hypothetical protein